MKIKNTIINLFVFILILILSGCSLGKKEMVGDDSDNYSCVGSAGYQWCPSTQKCQRMWEEYCGEFKDQFKVEDFNDCASMGNPIMESYPRQCRYLDQTFVEYVGNELEKMDLIRIDNPRPNQKITSPLIIRGEARGTWFFEASFPVILTDWDGLIIASGIATAKGDDDSTGSSPGWMTEDFVRFEAKLEFIKPTLYNNGSLILKKDNPSGLPEHDDALEIPIYFE